MNNGVKVGDLPNKEGHDPVSFAVVSLGERPLDSANLVISTKQINKETLLSSRPPLMGPTKATKHSIYFNLGIPNKAIQTTQPNMSLQQAGPRAGKRCEFGFRDGIRLLGVLVERSVPNRKHHKAEL